MAGIGLATIITLLVVKLKDKFSDTYPIVDYDLACMKNSYQIGQPSGVLDYLPNQASCETPFNLLVQPDVAFKPERRSDGCTFVELRYPG